MVMVAAGEPSGGDGCCAFCANAGAEIADASTNAAKIFPALIRKAPQGEYSS
jgi:hypothetical protein